MMQLLYFVIFSQGGMQPGGLNIGLSLDQGPADLRDFMVAYISYIDIYARGLRNAAKIVSDGVFTKNLQVF
jgi:xylose isomerase